MSCTRCQILVCEGCEPLLAPLGPVSTWDVAVARGVQRDDGGRVSMAEFDRVGLPMWGGCEVCAASIAGAGMFPSTSGNVRCRSCIGPDGFTTVEQFEKWCEVEDAR